MSGITEKLASGALADLDVADMIRITLAEGTASALQA
jgi:hypothetical protein